MKYLVIILLCIFYFVNTVSAAKQITATCDPWVPYAIQHDDGTVTGVAIEIVDAALKTQGYDITHILHPWKRSLLYVKSGQIDIVSTIWKTRNRQSFFKYSDPYIINQLKFVKRKNDTFEYTDLNSLKGKSVGVIKGYEYPDDFLVNQDFTREGVNDVIQNIRKLMTGRVDLMVDDSLVIENIFKRNPKFAEKLEIVDTPLVENSLHIVCKTGKARCSQIIYYFNYGLKNYTKKWYI